MIGGIGKAVAAIQKMDPKELPKIPAEAKKEQKHTAKVNGSLKKIGGLMNELGKLVVESNNVVADLAKSAQAKAKPTNENMEQLKKDATKAMEQWQAARIKLLEGKIAEVEKELETLRAWLADAKKTKPATWFK